MRGQEGRDEDAEERANGEKGAQPGLRQARRECETQMARSQQRRRRGISFEWALGSQRRSSTTRVPRA